MKKYLTHLTAFLFLMIFAVVPLCVAAADITPGSGWYLVPECARGFKNSDSCTFDNFLELLGKLMQFLVYLIIPLATLGILITGIKLTISGEAEKRAARKSMNNIALGIALTLAAYLIVETILKWLTKTGSVSIPGS